MWRWEEISIPDGRGEVAGVLKRFKREGWDLWFPGEVRVGFQHGLKDSFIPASDNFYRQQNIAQAAVPITPYTVQKKPLDKFTVNCC